MQTLGSLAIGSIVKFITNEVSTEFIIVHQGSPSVLYSGFENGTILLRRYIESNISWSDSSGLSYSDSKPHIRANTIFYNSIVNDIRNTVMEVRVPYQSVIGGSVLSGTNGLLCKSFMLSASEVGYDNGFTEIISGNNFVFNNPDGTRFSYFLAGDGGSARNLRIDPNNMGTWLRSTYTGNRAWEIYSGIGNRGTIALTSMSSYLTSGFRPAIVLPQYLKVDDSGNVIAIQPPTTPSSINIPATVKGGESTTITWGVSTDPQSEPISYVLEHNIDNSGWNIIYSGSELTFNDFVEYMTNTIQYRVKAVNQSGLESGYVISELRNVDNSTPPSSMLPQINAPNNLGTKTSPFSFNYTIT